MGTSRGSSTGARAAGDDGGGKKKKGLLPLLLGLLLLLALALLLFFLLRGDDDDSDRASSTATPTATATPSATPAGDGTSATGGAAAGAGTLTAGGTELLPVPDASELDATEGEAATGEGVTVQSVVPGQGFWVGTSETDRVYVELGGDTGEDEQPGQDVQVAEGDKVNLTGEVRPAPEYPAQTLRLDPSDGDLVKSQGIFAEGDVRGSGHDRSPSHPPSGPAHRRAPGGLRR